MRKSVDGSSAFKGIAHKLLMATTDSKKSDKPRDYVRTGLYVRAPNGSHVRAKRVERLARKMRRVMEWLQPADEPACRAWAELEHLSEIIYSSLCQHGVFNRNGEARRLLDDYRKLRGTQLLYANALGMSPAARIAIKADATQVALDLAAAMVAPSNGGDSALSGDSDARESSANEALSGDSAVGLAEQRNPQENALAGDSRAPDAHLVAVEVEIVAADEPGSVRVLDTERD